MSYKQRAITAAPELAVISHKCPANGCPNAAAVSFDGARWACFAHANAAPHQWPAVTQAIRDNWPGKANWNHPEKVRHEAEQAAKRRAALPPRKSAPSVDFSSVAELLEARA